MIHATFEQTIFTAKPANGCAGCLFSERSAAECHAACSAAKAAGLPDCDERAPCGNNYIYIEFTGDTRQIDLLA